MDSDSYSSPPFSVHLLYHLIGDEPGSRPGLRTTGRWMMGRLPTGRSLQQDQAAEGFFCIGRLYLPKLLSSGRKQEREEDEAKKEDLHLKSYF